MPGSTPSPTSDPSIPLERVPTSPLEQQEPDQDPESGCVDEGFDHVHVILHAHRSFLVWIRAYLVA